MTDLQVFDNPEFGSLEILWEDGKPLFRAVPVAEMLGYQKPHDAIQRHCRYSVKRGVPHPQNLSKTIEVIFIPEGDLYRLIVKSQLPSAQRFESWVFDDVLPSIRKTGFYATEDILNNPDLLIKLATELKNSKIQIKELESANSIKDQQIAELKPKASYYDVVLNCKDAVATSVIAKDFGKSTKWLNKFLEACGVQFFLKAQKVWLLKAKFQGLGYTKTKTQSFNGNDGEIHSSVHIYWTQKGRLFIYNLLGKYGFKPTIEG